jgi:hypothetical protein
MLSHFKTWPPIFASSMQIISVIYTRWVPWAEVAVYIRNGTYETLYMVDVGLSIGKEYAPLPGLEYFLYGARIATFFLLLSAVISFQSLAMSIATYMHQGTIEFREQLLLLVISVFCHLMAFLLYLILTISSLGARGSYDDGVLVTALTTAAGVACFFTSYTAGVLIRSKEKEQHGERSTVAATGSLHVPPPQYNSIP